MDKFAEIFKLDKILTEKGIPHTLEKFGDIGYQVIFCVDGKRIDDAVCHKYSHGYDEGLLETMQLNHCDGYETAEQVAKGWAAIYKKLTTKKN